MSNFSFSSLLRINPRVIWLFVALSLALPLTLKISFPPAEMSAANSFYDAVEKLPTNSGKIVLIAADWGPNVKAENMPQTEVAIEHLMRRRIPFALISIYQLSAPFLENVPLQVKKKLEAEMPEQRWEYGKDWVNLGYRFGSSLMIQKLAKAADFHLLLKTDAAGTPLASIPCMKNIHTLKDILMLMEFTGLVGAFNAWIQLFQVSDYRPPVVHGCTSITIPEAHIYFSSKQIIGLFEGVAGAAWYDHLLSQHFPKRKAGSARVIMTSLAFAHLIVIGFIILGNLGGIANLLRGNRTTRQDELH